MGKYNWNGITRNHVISAINKFLEEHPDYPEARSTFLIYEGKKLPAKHIRGMAYKEAFHIEVPKSEYSGGTETERFFQKLGFEVMRIKNDTKKITLNNPAEKIIEQRISLESNRKMPLKIGLYVQTEDFKNKKDFTEAMNTVKAADIDILVFPENCYTSFIEELYDLDPYYIDADFKILQNHTLELSKYLGCAVIISSTDKYGAYYSIFANNMAKDTDTKISMYTKHTMTYCSAFDFEEYKEKNWFNIIHFNGYRLGLTICYDCTHAAFSRMYGLQQVDILLNSTGGDILYDKWFKYNQVRSIENHCYSFVTMGGSGWGEEPRNYVYGFSPSGKLLKPQLINGSSEKNNVPGGIYRYTLKKEDFEPTIDSRLTQKETINKREDFFLPVGDMESVLAKATKVKENIYVEQQGPRNIIYCLVYNNDIFKPEIFLPLLYAAELRKYQNKCYVLVNFYDALSVEKFQQQLSVVLKVRAMENYCAVILEAPGINHCYQTGKTRTAQVIKAVNNHYGIDLSRTTGGEAIWKTKFGGQMQESWRNNYEWLIQNMVLLSDRSKNS